MAKTLKQVIVLFTDHSSRVFPHVTDIKFLDNGAKCLALIGEKNVDLINWAQVKRINYIEEAVLND